MREKWWKKAHKGALVLLQGKKDAYKAETFKHETKLFQKELPFHLKGLWGKVVGPYWGERREEEEDEEKGGSVREVPAHLYKAWVHTDTGGQFTHYASVGCKCPKGPL